MFDEKRFELYLKEIQCYPEMYVGKPSLERLASQLGGFQDAYRLMDVPLELFPGFRRFAMGKYPSDKILHYLEVIRQRCNFDDEKAFFFFFELLNEFLENGGKIALIHEENIYEENIYEEVCEESFENVEENRQD